MVKLKSYIKIYGPPIYKAITELQKMSVDMPEVCIMDHVILNELPQTRDLSEEPTTDFAHDFFESLGVDISAERCSNIISESRDTLGEYDFVFEWFTKPEKGQVNELIKKIDAVLAEVGVRYTIITK